METKDINEDAIFAITQRSLEKFEVIASQNTFNPNQTDIYGSSLLMNAIMVGQFDIVRSLVKKGARLDYRLPCDQRYQLSSDIKSLSNGVFSLAIYYYQYDIAQYLVERRVIVDHYYNFTPLLLILFRHLDQISTDLHRSIENYDTERSKIVSLIRLLVKNNVDVNVKDEEGNPIIWYALSSSYFDWGLDILKLFLEKGVEINILAGMEKISPLIYAIIMGNIPLVRLLIEKGADVNLVDSHEKSPLVNALIIENHEIVHLLIKAKADVNLKKGINDSPLEYAIRSKNYPIIRELLKSGANYPYKNNWSSLLWAHKSLGSADFQDPIGKIKIYRQITQFNHKHGLKGSMLDDTTETFIKLSSVEITRCLINCGKIDLLRQEKTYFLILPKDIIELIKDYLYPCNDHFILRFSPECNNDYTCL